MLAVVTGANRGIGLEVCRQIASQGWSVVLTARDPAKGEAAAASLREEGLDVRFLPLDVTSEQSAAALAEALSPEPVHALVNNAGVFLERGADATGVASPLQDIRRTWEINTLGPLVVTRALLPRLRAARGSSVVNVSSGMGQLTDMGTGYPGYRMSKTSLNALTRILSQELAEDAVRVSSVCPGWVRTDMGGAKASRSVEHGADTIAWLATQAQGPSGRFWRDREQIPW